MGNLDRYDNEGRIRPTADPRWIYLTPEASALLDAAPDLLAAAETLLAEYEHALAVIGEPFRWGRLVSDQMRAALAAARGEE